MTTTQITCPKCKETRKEKELKYFKAGNFYLCNRCGTKLRPSWGEVIEWYDDNLVKKEIR